MAKKRNIMLIYPPGRKFQRGEERCQSNIDESTSTSIRACNDLGYMASNLPDYFYPFIKDYQSELKSIKDLKEDLKKQNPNYVVLSTTNGTIFDDISTVSLIKKSIPDSVVILKGAIFFNASKNLLSQLNLDEVDYLIGGESEFVLKRLLEAHENKKGFSKVSGIIYKTKKGWKKTDFSIFDDNLDSLSFPLRELMVNSLYIRPDTGELQATISTSRGCPSRCTYCLTPIISGRKIRYRSPENIVEEIEECVEKHGIRNFFFKSDTFTMKKSWVLKLCNLMIKTGLSKKISWVANSRTKPADYEIFKKMKDAGCWLVALGIESGSNQTLKRIKKGATINDNKRTVRAAKRAGLKVFGFFMIGFPWEDQKMIKKTERHMRDLDCEFIELHLATPYYGTELYNEFESEGLLPKTTLGRDYFSMASKGTKYVPMKKLIGIRRKIILRYHIRPKYLLKKTFEVIKKPVVAISYFKHGIKIIRNNLKN